MRSLIVTEAKLTGESQHVVLERDELKELMAEGQVEALWKFSLCERGVPRGRPEATHKITGAFLQDGRPFASAIITTSNPDRDRDVVNPGGAKLSDYAKNPVVLPMHEHTFPIGFAEEIRRYPTRLWAQWQWLTDQPDTEAGVYQRLWDAYVLNATSIGFRPSEVEEIKGGGWRFNKWELLEFSPIVIPANAEAMRTNEVGDVLDSYGELVFAGVSPIAKSLWTAGEARGQPVQVSVKAIKGVIAYGRAHPDGTPKAPEDESWDGPAEVAAAEVDDLKVMCAWVDSDNDDIKGGYKLPHHKASGQHAVVWAGVSAAMGALLGARGGVDIPDGDKNGVYNHLARHYREFDKEPLEFRGVNMEEESYVANVATDEAVEAAKAATETSGQPTTEEPKTLDEAKLAFAAGAIDGDQFVEFVKGEFDRLRAERDAAKDEAEYWQDQAVDLAAGVVMRG